MKEVLIFTLSRSDLRRLEIQVWQMQRRDRISELGYGLARLFNLEVIFVEGNHRALVVTHI
jgi:hypothetical protein